LKYLKKQNDEVDEQMRSVQAASQNVGTYDVSAKIYNNLEKLCSFDCSRFKSSTFLQEEDYFGFVKSKFIKNADNFDLQDMEVEEIGQETQ